MTDLERDIETIQKLIDAEALLPAKQAWHRIRARLTPDRERVAAGLRKKCLLLGLSDEVWLELADAAIDAMGKA